MKICTQCGKSLDDSFAVCPYCGTPAAPAQQPFAPSSQAPAVSPAKTLVFGIIGLAGGVISTLLTLLLMLTSLVEFRTFLAAPVVVGMVAGLIGLVFSILGRSASTRYALEGGIPCGKSRAGRTMATVGLVLSILGLVLGIVSIVLAATGVLRDPFRELEPLLIEKQEPVLIKEQEPALIKEQELAFILK